MDLKIISIFEDKSLNHGQYKHCAATSQLALIYFSLFRRKRTNIPRTMHNRLNTITAEKSNSALWWNGSDWGLLTTRLSTREISQGHWRKFITDRIFNFPISWYRCHVLRSIINSWILVCDNKLTCKALTGSSFQNYFKTHSNFLEQTRQNFTTH